MNNISNILEVKNLRVSFKHGEEMLEAVSGVSFNVGRGETLGIVGESGCGKSVTALSIMQLLPRGVSRLDSGEVVFCDRNLLDLTKKEVNKIRGKDMAMIYQEPMTALNPVFRIGNQLEEVIRQHLNLDKKAARQKAIDLLTEVGIPMPEKRIDEYPHQMSGGMRQRVMIAMGLACNPKLLIADEPTTALDVTIQAQILDLMKNLKSEFGTSIIMITHDLGVIAEMAERVIVMYAGQIMEISDTESLFEDPLHPYTGGLLYSMPRLDKEVSRLSAIKGSVPIISDMPKGCRYHPRCEFVTDRCKAEIPDLIEVGKGRYCRCFKYGDKTGLSGDENSKGNKTSEQEA